METAVSVRGLVRKYKKGFQLGPLDFDISPGTVVGLVGPNGSGKTTLINTLVGLLYQDAGSIKIFGRETKPNDATWRFDIGYVGDTQHFYEYWSCEKNLSFRKRFYPKWNDERVFELADRFRLNLKSKTHILSKGNRTKLALIIALAHSPRLLLLDEPTAGLDPVVRLEFLDTLWELLESTNSAVLFSTHIISDIARIADELAFLDDGKLIIKQPKHELEHEWCQISFEMDNMVNSVDGMVSLITAGVRHQVISSNLEVTKNHLKVLGAKNVKFSPLSIEEIAVEILKGGYNAANNQG